MSETTCLESMYNFYNMVVAVFDIVYLIREPNVEHTAEMLSVNEARCVVHG
jgi:hypothetical protein